MAKASPDDGDAGACIAAELLLVAVGMHALYTLARQVVHALYYISQDLLLSLQLPTCTLHRSQASQAAQCVCRYNSLWRCWRSILLQYAHATAARQAGGRTGAECTMGQISSSSCPPMKESLRATGVVMCWQQC